MKLLSVIFLTLSFSFLFSLNSNAFQIDISKKYNNIFSSKVLSDNDVINYQQAYLFQEQCK